MPLLFRIHLLTIVVATLAAAQSVAQPDPSLPGMLLTSAEAEQEIIQGREALMAFRLDEAELTFRRLFHSGANEIPAYYHLTAIGFVRAMFRQDEPAYQLFFARSDSLYDMLKDADDSPWHAFFRSDLFLMRSFVRARRGDYIRAAVSAKEAYESYIETLRLDPTLIDAERGVGVLKTIIGATPSAYRRFIRMFGYSGSIDEGIRLLEHVIQKGRYAREESALFLALTRVFLNIDRDEGIAILAEKFEATEDPVTGLVYAFSLRMARRPEESVDVAERAIRTMKSPGYTDVEFLYYHLGSALFSLNRFEEAAAAYRSYIETFDGQSYQASSRLRLGLCLEMLGRRAEAEVWYAQVEAPTDFDLDQAAQREARRRLKNPLTDADKVLLRGENAISAGQYNEAIEILEKVFFSDAESQLDRTEAAYLLGRAHHLLKEWDEAATKYVYARTHPVSKNVRWAPWSTYYLGRVRAETDHPDEARRLFQEAIDFKGKYDYKKSLQRSAKLALEKLDAKR